MWKVQRFKWRFDINCSLEKKESVLERKVVTFQKVFSETDGFLCFETIFVLYLVALGDVWSSRKKKFLGFFLFSSVLLFCFSLWCHVQKSLFLSPRIRSFFFSSHRILPIFEIAAQSQTNEIVSFFEVLDGCCIN